MKNYPLRGKNFGMSSMPLQGSISLAWHGCLLHTRALIYSFTLK